VVVLAFVAVAGFLDMAGVVVASAHVHEAAWREISEELGLETFGGRKNAGAGGAEESVSDVVEGFAFTDRHGVGNKAAVGVEGTGEGLELARTPGGEFRWEAQVGR